MHNQQSAAAGWVGYVLAGHRIDALVGEGGMGAVYRATHLNLRRTVALKVLHPALAADLDYRRRFEREAAIAASLEHPAVVPIYDAGHQNGVLYLSMRYVDGDDLAAVLQREGRLDVERLCALLEPVADALDTVHGAGLVHRDVKPGNILIARPGRSRAGQVYLCDFGIAKGPADAGLTSAGQYVGTLQYSSPEQITGQWIDGRADQYGLACLAFRGLTGQVPYPRDDTAAVIYAHLTADPPRPGLLRTDLPAAVDAVFGRAAAKDPARRFPSCSAFVAALRAAATTPRPAAPRPEPAAPAPGPPVVAPRPRPAPTAPDPVPAPRPLPPTRPLPEPAGPPGSGPAGPAEPAEPAGDAAPAPVDVRAERDTGDPSITVSWTAGGPQEAEYKVTRLTPEGRWHVVGRTRTTRIIDGAVSPDAAVPEYAVVARVGTAVSATTRSAAAPPRPPTPEVAPAPAVPAPAFPPADVPAPDGFPSVRELTVSATGTLAFDWPTGVTEAMVVVRHDRPPEAPDDPAATSWKITNMRYQLDGGLLLPRSVALPCHVAVATCRRERGALVVAPGFGPTARTSLEA